MEDPFIVYCISEFPSVLGRCCAPLWSCCSALIYPQCAPFHIGSPIVFFVQYRRMLSIGRLGLICSRYLVSLRFQSAIELKALTCLVCRRLALRRPGGLVGALVYFQRHMRRSCISCLVGRWGYSRRDLPGLYFYVIRWEFIGSVLCSFRRYTGIR